MRKIGDNKQGQQMTLGTIIAIALGVAVLVFLIFGFTKGWGNLWDNVVNLGGGAANVDNVKRGCEVACASNSKDAYCNQVRTLKFGKESDRDDVKGNCSYFVEQGEIDISCDISC